ncbi:hypothetical protein JL09_g6965 [Pichia kudriavzevii]|uniref:Uncharacterized protein n=1 Tax=Pichia kudriavzevii TaxID=4909 RepID=A0A099NIC6_PICKU|nr:hypothetical protein JL09_g6965 [Pichia kudriavzevii]
MEHILREGEESRNEIQLEQLTICTYI